MKRKTAKEILAEIFRNSLPAPLHPYLMQK